MKSPPYEWRGKEPEKDYLNRLQAYWESEDGKAWQDRDAREHAAQAAAEERAKVARQVEWEERRIRALELPERARYVLEAGANVTGAIAELAASDGKPIVVLSGNPGSGKTIAAAQWLYAARVGLFVKSARLSRWQRYDDEEMARLLNASRLVIDDLGTEYQDVKGNFMAILDEVIDVRYDSSKPTVITTNLDAEAFKARYGERITDRIREAGRFISLDVSSMRSAG